MLWSLLKILVFVAIIGLLALGAGFLLETSGGVQITVAGTEYTLGPLQSAIALGMLLVAVWVFLKLLSLLVATWKFLNGDETALSRYFDRGREKRGYQALADGLMALASGEGRVAMAKAKKAEGLLEKPELTNVLLAQAADMAGDTKTAEATYKKLVSNNTTRFVGVRGVMKQRLADGDTETARKLAEKALLIKPKHEETQDVLLFLQTQAEDWAGARNTLNTKLKSGTLPRDVFKRRDAVLALSEARDIVAEGSSVGAKERAILANKLSPDLVPAAAMAARSYLEQGKPRYATRVLKKAWEVHPHPELAHAFAEIVPDETPVARIKRFQVLTKIQPQHPETKLLLTELNIVGEDFPEARRALGDLAEQAEDARSLTLMAAIERGEGASDAVVQGWLAKALSAPRGPQWVCDNCNTIQAHWAPTCGNCGSFDTLSWKTPPVPELTSATGVHMLPLIVGALEDKTEEPEPEEDIVEGEVLDDAAEAPADPEPEIIEAEAEEDPKQTAQG
jgi:HemY protein